MAVQDKLKIRVQTACSEQQQIGKFDYGEHSIFLSTIQHSIPVCALQPSLFVPVKKSRQQ